MAWKVIEIVGGLTGRREKRALWQVGHWLPNSGCALVSALHDYQRIQQDSIVYK